MHTDRWERVAQPVLVVASLLYLAAYSLQVLLVEPPSALLVLLQAVVWGTWALFLIDYVIRLALATHRAAWFLHHLFDLATVALPFLRPLRLLQLFALVRVLNRQGAAAARGRTVAYAVGAAVFVVYVGALAEFSVERDARGADIRSFGDAVWWAITTVTTVGYGDYAPVTVAGRVIATGIMIVGIAVLGSVTAAVTSWLVQQAGRRGPSSEERSMHDELARIHQRLTELGDRQAAGAAPAGAAPHPARTPSPAPPPA